MVSFFILIFFNLHFINILIGQLAQGDIEDRGDDVGEMGTNLSTINLGTGLTAQHLALGYDHTCIFLSNDRFKCWGRGNEGFYLIINANFIKNSYSNRTIREREWG